MSRETRVERAGAINSMTRRGGRQEDSFQADVDRRDILITFLPEEPQSGNLRQK